MTSNLLKYVSPLIINLEQNITIGQENIDKTTF